MTLAKKQVPMESGAPSAGATPFGPKKQTRLTALLVTSDDSLWPVVSRHFGSEFIGKQVDGVDELMSAIPPGQPAVVLWDARRAGNPVAILSQLQLHSSRFVVVTLDDPERAAVWATPLRQRLIAVALTLPAGESELAAAIREAGEEAHGRLAVLGDGGVDRPQPAPGRSRRWLAAAAIGMLVIAAAATVAFLPRHASTPATVTPTPTTGMQALPRDAQGDVDEKVDFLIDKAHQAMTARHFIDPTDGSALNLYREALLLRPGNTEAKQGLQRLAEILISRINSALDERQFDVALQSLETVHNIDPEDPRLGALDARVAGLRTELGSSQIQAAIVAQNFDRASQLIDEAAKSKVLAAGKLAQLREDVRKHREQADATRLVSLADARMQQDRLIDPARDSAAYYLGQARAAGASASAMQPQIQEFIRRATQSAHDAIEQHRLTDAERLLAELRGEGAPPSSMAALQHEMTAVRGQSTTPKPEQPPSVDLARSRLAQGNLVTPDDDSALYYWNQLRAAEPNNPNVAPLADAIQTQILAQARAALDGAQVANADVLLQQAVTLGPSPALSSLEERLTQVKMTQGREPPTTLDVTEASLTRRSQLNLVYPYGAERDNVEGWVEVHYTVMADGKVGQLTIASATPPGVFDAAAKTAIRKLRYQPYLRDGKPVAVNTALKVVFRVAKAAGPK